MSTKTVWVSGGAGFLGRCTAEVLKNAGFEPFVLDSFFTGHRDSVKGLDYAEIDLADFEAVKTKLPSFPTPFAVFHFAARALVGESVQKPEIYFRNNVLSTTNLMEAALEKKCRYFIHSSSCAVYGVPLQVPIVETTTQNPISPYGESKRMAEGVLAQYSAFRDVRVANLRYFNPVGSLRGKFGEKHDPETHLVPNVVKAIAHGQKVPVFGTDYPTPDGTCVRDYLHVADLADAHIAALRYLETLSQPSSVSLNLGSGSGKSVKEVIRAAEACLGKKAILDLQPRRPGDPPELWADISAAKKLLSWAPKHSLEDAIQDHWAFLTNR